MNITINRSSVGMILTVLHSMTEQANDQLDMAKRNNLSPTVVKACEGTALTVKMAMLSMLAVAEGLPDPHSDEVWDDMAARFGQASKDAHDELHSASSQEPEDNVTPFKPRTVQ